MIKSTRYQDAIILHLPKQFGADLLCESEPLLMLTTIMLPPQLHTLAYDFTNTLLIDDAAIGHMLLLHCQKKTECTVTMIGLHDEPLIMIMQQQIDREIKWYRDIAQFKSMHLRT